MQAVAAVAAYRAIQFPGHITRSSTPIQPIQHYVQRTYANKVRDSILRRTRQMSGIQSPNRRVQFLCGVEVRESGMAEWIETDDSFKPVWLG